MIRTNTCFKIFFSLLLLQFFGSMSLAQKGNHILIGKLVDAQSLKSLEWATVQLMWKAGAKDSSYKTVATQLTNKKGEFNFSGLPAGDIRINLSLVGYQGTMVSTQFPPSPFGTSKDLGNIKLNKDSALLTEVVVNSKNNFIEFQQDKKVFNVEKLLAATGGTALDIIKTLPGISVDAQNNITVRNAAPLIFIDGKPSVLSPDQIPSEQIASVELLTNPSARYDAGSGAAGIINIVLKKNRKAGYNGNLRAGIDMRPRPYIGGDFNLKQGKINFFASAMLTSRKNFIYNHTQRTEFVSPHPVETRLDGKLTNKGYYGFGRWGLDYFLSNRSTLSAIGIFAKGHFNIAGINHITKDTPALIGMHHPEYINRSIDAGIGYQSLGGALSFKHNFSKEGKELTADIHYNRNKLHNQSDYNSIMYDELGNLLVDLAAERALGSGTTHFYTAQTDFVNPLSAKSKIETGIRVVGMEYNSFNDNYRENSITHQMELINGAEVDYKFKDLVAAAYGTYTLQRKSTVYQIGLRAESSGYTGKVVNKNIEYKNNYPLSLFPSLYITKTLKNNRVLQFNYSRKINRPGLFHILPFIDYSDSLNLLTGSPSIKPEFVQLGELAYQANGKRQTFIATLYGKYSHRFITRYFYKDKNPDNASLDSVVFLSYINARKSYSYGLELLHKINIAKWWQLTSSVNAFKVYIEAKNIPQFGSVEKWSWNAKLNQTFIIPKGFMLQINAEYLAKTLTPPVNTSTSATSFGGGMYGSTQASVQGFIKPVYGLDISIKKDLLKKKNLSLILQFLDVLNSRRTRTYTNTHYFEQHNSLQRDPQFLRLNIAWRFGKPDALVLKRKNKKAEQEGSQRVQPGM